MKTLTYIGHVTQTGEIKLPKRVGAEVRRYFVGKDIQVSFSKLKKTRSSEQNRYYWGVVVRMVCEGFADLGNPVNPDSPEDTEMVHDFLKRRFLQPIQVADANGEAHSLGYTTTQLSTSGMADYIAQIQQFAAEYLNITIPDPGEQSQLWQ
jgi:hypothetical protein